MEKNFSFPKDFLWGTATSSYQIEGGNFNNDWHLWEQQGKTAYPCGQAIDSYHRFNQDSDLIQSLGQNTHRLSFEWSRIQPSPDTFDDNEIEHYKKIIRALKERNITPMITLHHFTNPRWFYERNGWLNPKAPQYFAGYAAKIAGEFSGLSTYWITINEPLVYIYNSFIKGIWPPGEQSLKKAFIVLRNMIKAHGIAYKILHKANPHAKVSIAKHLRIFNPCPHHRHKQNIFPAFLRNRLFNYFLLEYLAQKKTLDFIGLNYYTMNFVSFTPKDIFGTDCFAAHHTLRQNALGWYVYPEGLFKILMRLKKFRLPVIITENGTTENSDNLYQEFLIDHLQAVAKAIEKGVNVTGYFWWSLVDNFEWEKGFNAHFGLAGVDQNLTRVLKPFARLYKDICMQNKLPKKTNTHV